MGLCRLIHLYAAERREHPNQCLPLRLQVYTLLHHVQSFSLHGVPVTLGCCAVLLHRLQFPLVAGQQLLQVSVQLHLLVNQQQGEVHLVHALANNIYIYLVLYPLYLTLRPCYLLLAADGPSVEHRLLHFDTHTVLVLRQPFHVDTHLLIQCLHLVRERHHVALISGLC